MINRWIKSVFVALICIISMHCQSFSVYAANEYTYGNPDLIFADGLLSRESLSGIQYYSPFGDAPGAKEYDHVIRTTSGAFINVSKDSNVNEVVHVVIPNVRIP